MKTTSEGESKSVLASRLAALGRLRALYEIYGTQLTRDKAIFDIRQLGFREFWDSDADPLLRDFSRFIDWYKPEKRQLVKDFREFVRQAELQVIREREAVLEIARQAELQVIREREALLQIARQEELQVIREREALLQIARQEELQVIRERDEALRATVTTEFYCNMRRLTAEHAAVLLRKRRRFVFKNEYGVVKGREKWIEEVRSFVTDLMAVPDHLESQYDAPNWASRMDIWLDELAVPQQNNADPIALMSGPDFEVHCADVLRNAGWEVIRNGRSGDQGVDLIASRPGLRVAIQCKRYAGSVGNKAVQEVFAGMTFEGCDRAAVVSNAPFTAAAISLARASRVLLIDDLSLSEFDHWLAQL
jgi:restriction system protein